MRVSSFYSAFTKPICLVALVAVVAGCNRDKDAIAFDGFVFRAKTAAIDKKVSRADFRSTIQDAGRSLDGAREAARYEGTKYCIANYGTSKVEWSVGPDSDASLLTLVDGDLTFRGRCDP